jgi:hypothetical protein
MSRLVTLFGTMALAALSTAGGGALAMRAAEAEEVGWVSAAGEGAPEVQGSEATAHKHGRGEAHSRSKDNKHNKGCDDTVRALKAQGLKGRELADALGEARSAGACGGSGPEDQHHHPQGKEGEAEAQRGGAKHHHQELDKEHQGGHLAGDDHRDAADGHRRG